MGNECTYCQIAEKTGKAKAAKERKLKSKVNSQAEEEGAGPWLGSEGKQGVVMERGKSPSAPSLLPHMVQIR